MENKNVGWLIVGIAAFIGIIIAIFYFGVNKIIGATCSHGPSCGMYDSLRIQTWISISIAFVVLLIGIFFIFTKPFEKIIIKKIKPEASLKPIKFDKKSLEKLNAEEKKIMTLLLKNNNSIFQSELIEQSGINKVKITRILDGLEAQGLIERRRRGMTNIVMLKNNQF